MLIRDFRQGRIFFARLDHSADIISQITNLAEEVYLQELSGVPLKRVPDSITGLALWGEER